MLITQSAQSDSTLVQITCDTVDVVGDALGITMGTNVSGSAIVLTGT